MSWQDSKFGTILNILILLVSIPALGNFHFRNMVETEKRHLQQDFRDHDAYTVTLERSQSLPPAVSKWLETSGVIGKPGISYG